MTITTNSSINPIDIEYHDTHEKEWEIKNHFHNSYEIIYVLDGSVEVIINDKTYIANSNNIVFISNLESHQLKVLNNPYLRYVILLKPDYFQSIINHPILASILKHRPENFRHIIVLNSGSIEIKNIFQKMHQEITHKSDFWESNLYSLLNLLLVELYRSYKEYFPLTTLNNSMKMILDIQKYMENNYLEEITLKEISKLFHSDMYYLSHLFKNVTGFTFKEYLIRLRISKAKDLLINTSDNITKVGLDSGFNNVNHFIRIFKKYENTTPYQFRKKLR